MTRPCGCGTRQTGTDTARLEGHTYGVNALAVLPDGRLASGGFG